MKAVIDAVLCAGCGLGAEIYPEVFDFMFYLASP